MKPEIIKLEENIGEKLLSLGLVNKFFFFFTVTPKTQATKMKIHKWQYIKLKSSIQ